VILFTVAETGLSHFDEEKTKSPECSRAFVALAGSSIPQTLFVTRPQSFGPKQEATALIAGVGWCILFIKPG
jgi:hypothetical protein